MRKARQSRRALLHLRPKFRFRGEPGTLRAATGKVRVMKKLLILLALVGIGVVVAIKVREATA